MRKTDATTRKLERRGIKAVPAFEAQLALQRVLSTPEGARVWNDEGRSLKGLDNLLILVKALSPRIYIDEVEQALLARYCKNKC